MLFGLSDYGLRHTENLEENWTQCLFSFLICVTPLEDLFILRLTFLLTLRAISLQSNVNLTNPLQGCSN